MQHFRVLEADDIFTWRNDKIRMDYHLEVEWRKTDIKKEGGEISFPKRIVSSKQGYRKNLQSTEEKILKAVRREGVDNQETTATFKGRRKTENLQELKEWPLYAQFTRQIEDEGNKKTRTLNN